MELQRFALSAALGLALPFALVTTVAARIHVVEPGDTLSYLADIYVVTVDEIAGLNGIVDPNLIFPGQEINLPGGDTPAVSGGELNGSYTVQPGDTLSGIAAHFGISTSELQAANGLSDPDYLWVGQALTVPGLASAEPEVGIPPLQFPARPDDPEIEAIIDEFAAAYGVDPGLVKALATVESGWTQSAVSTAGARGVMQIMPGTAVWLEEQIFGMDLYEQDSAYDNIKMGTKYLALLLAETNGDQRAAVASYYQGLSPTQAGVYYPDTQNYVATVLAVRLTYWP